MSVLHREENQLYTVWNGGRFDVDMVNAMIATITDIKWIPINR